MYIRTNCASVCAGAVVGIFLPLWEARTVMIAVFRRKTVAEVMSADQGAVPSRTLPC